MDEASPPLSPRSTLPGVRWTLFDIVRLISFATTFIVVLCFLLVLSPLTLLNPFLRSHGWSDDAMPASRLFAYCSGILLYCGGVGMVVQRPSKPITGPVIYMFTHASNLDPLIVMWTTGRCPKFIFKRELGFIPVFGWIMHLYGHIAINRSKRDDAIASLKVASRNIITKNKSVAISPEGTRSRTGQLMPFKRGPFHLAHECTGVPIVPVVIRNAYTLLPPKKQFFHSGYVHITILDPISTSEATPPVTVDSLSIATEKAIRDNLKGAVNIPPPALQLLVIPFVMCGFYGLIFFYRFFS